MFGGNKCVGIPVNFMWFSGHEIHLNVDELENSNLNECSTTDDKDEPVRDGVSAVHEITLYECGEKVGLFNVPRVKKIEAENAYPFRCVCFTATLIDNLRERPLIWGCAAQQGKGFLDGIKFTTEKELEVA